MNQFCAGRVVSAAGFAMVLSLTGCGNFGDGFFQDPNSPTTPTPATSGDYVYVVNSSNTLSEFSVASATLTAVSGSPITLPSGLAAASVTVDRQNTYVYVGGNGAIECYSIGTGGALTQVTGDTISEQANFVSLDTSPDGRWLFALDNLNNEVYVFGINSSTGALTIQGSQYPISIGGGLVLAANSPAKMLKIAPNGSVLAVAAGNAGDEVFTFDTASTSGVLTSASSVNALPSGYSDDSVAFDGTSTVAPGFLIIGRGITGTGVTSQLLTYAVTASTGALGASVTNSYNSGADPFALLLDPTGAYVYAANKGDGTVSGYTYSAGALTAISGSPYASGAGATALAEDNSKKYVIAAAAGGSSDLTLYAFDALTAGKLDPVAIVANGSGVAGSIALATTH